MEISPYSLFLMLLYSFAIGGGLGLLYDCFRIARVMTGRNELTGSNSGALEKLNRIMLPMPILTRKVFGEKVLPFGSLRKKHGRVHKIVTAVWLFFEDILFFVLCGVAVALLMYYTNDGQFRLMALVTVSVGFAVYYITVGRIVLSSAYAVSFAIRVTVTYLVLILLTPLAFFFKLLKKLFGYTFGRIYRAHREKRAIRRDAAVMKEICLFLGIKTVRPQKKEIKKKKINADRKVKKFLS